MREQIARHAIPQRASRTNITPQRPVQRVQEDPEDEILDEYYPQRLPSSARRQTTTEGQRVIQQGNRRIIIHDTPPPRKRNAHWSFWIGIGMIVMFALWLGGSELSTWWTNHQLDATYGNPRTYQVDQAVGHGDSTDHPTHFLFLNLHGHVLIIELPGGNGAHARIYSGATLFSDTADQTPITGEFRDVNGDGKIDLIVHIGDQRIIYLNDGTQFKLQQ